MTGRPLPHSRFNPRLFDGVLVTVLLAVGVGSIFLYSDTVGAHLDGDALGVFIIVLTTLPLLLRRRYPGAVGLFVPVAMLLYLEWDYAALTALPIMLIAAYSVGAYARLGMALATLGVHLAVTVTFLVLSLDEVSLRGTFTYNLLFIALGFGGAVVIGHGMRQQRIYTSALEARADQLEQSRDAELRAALIEERSRIARELHDVVAHHVSVMTVQAAGAQRSLDRNPEGSAEALRSIESTGRAALGEIRRLLDIFRGSEQRQAPEWTTHRGPQPGVADLEELIEQVRAAGVHVDLVVEPGLHDVPAGVNVTVFRIVQEALTNTLKHAGPSKAEVQLSRTADALLVRVRDDGRGMAAGLEDRRRGHGLLGMRERVTLYGGTLAVGPRPEGGYEVRARIPFDPSEHAAVPR
ncbi:sensor histidine kinase [Phytoactinopolyspora mesophila]|uniref:histidine kinase n=1 Tax=Phytoactinopolyspora mesophila TaxID=2650750 RepID=A0A7K3LYL1_9ACTN|nr:sensor histidine kinase [Phytoactinopolyspora mesophila]NDL56104.1 sensor histidine kinase [Phytoactinopolyspora mesophila]